MLHSVLPLTEHSFIDANVHISGVEMGILEVPLYEVNIKSSFLKWQHFMKSRDGEKTEKLAEKFPGVFPASVVTHSVKAKREAIKKQGKEEIGLSGTFLENIGGVEKGKGGESLDEK